MRSRAARDPAIRRAASQARAVAYFIYYRVRHNAAGARVRVRAAQRDLASATGVRGRLLRKTDETALWMEVYEPVRAPAAFEAALADAVVRHGLNEILALGSQRKVERFGA
jgi:hypothetical protein